MLDFILGFILIWIMVAVVGFMMFTFYNCFLEEFLEEPVNRKRAVVFLEVTVIITLMIIFAIKIWG